MFTSRSTISSILVVAVCLCLVGCTAAQIITDLNVALNAAEVLIPLITPFLGASTSPQIAKVSNAVQAGLAGVAAVADCQSKGGTKVELSMCVTANLAGVVANEPDLTGLPSNIAIAAQNFFNYLNGIVKTYGTPTTPTLGVDANLKVSLPWGSSGKLQAIGVRALADQARLASAR